MGARGRVGVGSRDRDGGRIYVRTNYGYRPLCLARIAKWLRRPRWGTSVECLFVCSHSFGHVDVAGKIIFWRENEGDLDGCDV